MSTMCTFTLLCKRVAELYIYKFNGTAVPRSAIKRFFGTKMISRTISLILSVYITSIVAKKLGKILCL